MKPTNRLFLSAITVAAATILLFMLPALAAQAQAPIQSGVLSAAPFHTCALKADGNVTCWGQDAWGVLDAPAGPFTQVTANQYHGCGLLEDGFVDCWGGIPPDPNDPRYWYMLYDQTDPPRAIFTQISAGDVHNCGLEPPGSVRCWGSVRSGQAGLHTGPYTGHCRHASLLRADGIRHG